MARPRKQGLDYFPLDVDIFSDEKVIAIAGEFGTAGEITIVKLLCAIYRNGYYIEWSEMMKFKLLTQLPGVDAALLDRIVGRLVHWGFFDRALFEQEGVLTSRGIQHRFFEASRKRVRTGAEPLPHLLCGEQGDGSARRNACAAQNPCATQVPEAETPVSGGVTPQSKAKESETKAKSPCGEKETKCGATGNGALPPPTQKEVSDFIESERLDVDAAIFFTHYAARGWRINGTPVADWRPLARNWSLRQPGHTPLRLCIPPGTSREAPLHPKDRPPAHGRGRCPPCSRSRRTGRRSTRSHSRRMAPPPRPRPGQPPLLAPGINGSM